MAFNILIVDDSASTRIVIKKILGISGIDVGQVFDAGNGREALAVLEREWVDVILTDVHMPEMDGFELLKALKDRSSASSAPVVVVTTEGREDRIGEFLSLGARACIRKPFKPEQIKKTLMQVLGTDDGAPAGPDAFDGCDF